MTREHGVMTREHRVMTREHARELSCSASGQRRELRTSERREEATEATVADLVEQADQRSRRVGWWSWPACSSAAKIGDARWSTWARAGVG